MKKLVTEEYLADPRIAEAKRLLAMAAREHQSKLTGVRAADGERKVGYEEMIRTFGEARGGGLFFPYLGAGLGNGALVELADGSVKFDLISGIGVHHWGHSHPRLMAAGVDAAVRDTVMQGNLQQNVESAALAKALLERAVAGTRLAHCFLTSSGAMANENALKMAFHKRPGAGRVLAFEHTFAGRTLALSSVTDKAAYRAGLPAALAVDYLPFFDAENPEASTARAVAALRNLAARYPGQYGVIWCELVLGEGGFYSGSARFWRAICAEAQARNIVVVADEVQTFGRTSKLFAYQHFEIEEWVDIVTVGKMLQVCATLFVDALKPAPGIVSQTFTAGTAAIMAAGAIVTELLGAELFGEDGRNARVHGRFVTRFTEIAERHAGWVRGPYGVGGMVAFTPLDGSEETAKKVVKGLFEAGVISFYCGSEPTRVRFLPPVPVIKDEQIDEVCGMVEAVLAATTSK